MAASPSPDQLALRLATKADHSAMAELFEAGFDEPFGLPAILDLLNPPGSFAVIAEGLTDDPSYPMKLGFVILSCAAEEAEIYTITVHPLFRKLGVGNALLDYGVSEARNRNVREFFLEVAVDNAAAIALYANFGFKRVGLRKNYYRRSSTLRIDALIMKKEYA